MKVSDRRLWLLGALVALCCLFPHVLHAGDVGLGWDPVEPVDGYRVYWRGDPGDPWGVERSKRYVPCPVGDSGADGCYEDKAAPEVTLTISDAYETACFTVAGYNEAGEGGRWPGTLCKSWAVPPTIQDVYRVDVLVSFEMRDGVPEMASATLVGARRTPGGMHLVGED